MLVLEERSDLAWARLYLDARRPWLELYATRLRARSGDEDGNEHGKGDEALINRMLPGELLLEVLLHCSAVTIANASVVCKRWRYAAQHPMMWRAACMSAWGGFEGEQACVRACRRFYGGSWRRMFMEKPRLRTDGVYASRNTYIKVGACEWAVHNPVHLVCYFRYLRFKPDGMLLYRTTAEKVAVAARQMGAKDEHDPNLLKGRYNISGCSVDIAVSYPGGRAALAMRLSLRSTVRGGNNRLDVLSLSVIDHRTGEEDEHTRGKATFVFVPFQSASSSVLNLDIHEMDYYVPG
eukprot:jgi/Chlat1/5392/Chrsp35S05305